ncbi:RagB/SusD family nutrient uptake outer membrane protein [Echinicola soli]|nr:RagB/SusD family nutrient uptake outer membrane protein [Echinicola soli]
MKKIIYSLILMVLLAGCTTLEEDVFSELSPTNFYTSAADADAAVIAIYNGLNRRPFHDTYFTSLTFMQAPHSATRAAFRRMYANYSFDASENRILGSYWAAAYDIINRANAAIDRIPSIEMDENEKASLVAEAKWLRAYNYFNLVRFFGDVPLLLKESTSLEDANPSRAPMDEVYAAIVADLKEGLDNLPPSRGNGEKMGRVAAGTAKFLLAKVYLTMAGEPLNDASHLQEAHTLLSDLYANRGEYGFGLLENYADIFDLENELNAEIVFAVQQSRIEGQGTAMAHMWGPLRSPFGGTGQYHGGCTQEFYESYDDTDERRDVTWLERYQLRGANQVVVFGERLPNGALGPYGETRNGMSPAKYQDPEQECCDGETDIIIYRFSDVMLMLAEIENELNGPGAAALGYLNEVRERANATVYDPQAATSQEEFRELIYKERFWEFSFEFHEIFDIRRMGKVQEAIETGFETQLFGTVYDPRYELYPIPLTEIQTNSNITQNPGW